MSDQNWASKIASRFESRLAEVSQKDAKFIEKQKIRREYTKALWNEIKLAFNEKHMAINKQLGREILTMEDSHTSNRIVLRRNEPTSESMLAMCEEPFYRIIVSFGKDDAFKSLLEVEIDENSGKGYLAKSYQGNTRTNPVDVAESAIEHLLGI